ncbi:MAG: Rne/Rng family ribonuclease, partial [Planctomycetota bacterium]|nr:Rne/Rng family ribonuclease [Planctomycetota bacterium]
MASKPKAPPTELMVVNDSPGEECRIAILEDNHLEELYAERAVNATNVGNIYKGRVVNVESAIQAAFIDYGKGVNGFLHISDLHPRYFPGAGRTERVGKKIPRRERPPIQEALRRGDEVLVQVLKEGIGTKGPTLTSYLSIPGRLLVVMPDMDRVGVSRKVEDEERRREMRKVLDSLDLPDGFGFILRTAGFGQTKTELKRDVAYLMRLWKVMEKRIKKASAPCDLYTESDLLIRTLRDVLRPSIEVIIVDSESAYERVTSFLSVIAPRSAPKVVRYHRSTPIFHAFDIERQIELTHNREVPLTSGGQVVIEQTEALVAIDVNSGRSRGARDSETNAYQTNCEAVDEICRQLRLRDLGGLIINDLIDMHQNRHRRAIEERFRNRLKRDRARSTILRISQFGLLEMTRQRMRPSLHRTHFVTCPTCRGHGDIKAPDSVAADVTRQVGFLLDHDRVKRVEIVCSPRVASVLLSRKRWELVRIEESAGKMIDVRVSDDIAVDRVDYYAYDDRNADVSPESLPPSRAPKVSKLEAEDEAFRAAEKKKEKEEPEEIERSAPRKRSRRRRRSGP